MTQLYPLGKSFLYPPFLATAGKRGTGRPVLRGMSTHSPGTNGRAARIIWQGVDHSIVIDAEPSSPRAGNTARSAERQYWGAERQPLLQPGEGWDKLRVLGEPMALWLGLMGGYSGICGPWQRFG